MVAAWTLGGPPASSPAPVTGAEPGTRTTAGVAPELLTPTSLRIPVIGVDTDLVRLGLNDDDTVEVPSDPRRAGWFFPGTVPGQRGSSVILGHVDSPQGPAVFHRLSSLAQGDRILIRMSDGSRTHFTVTRVVTYPNDEFPAQRVYAGTPRRATLSLVTCGGKYDADAGGYQANVVVFAQRS